MLAAIAALCLIGLTQIYSTTSSVAGGPSRIWITQAYGIGLGIIALLVCLAIDYRTLADKSHWIYGGMLALLFYVLFFGVVRGGSQTMDRPAGVQPAAIGVRTRPQWLWCWRSSSATIAAARLRTPTCSSARP